jgi:hypothetical protein
MLKYFLPVIEIKVNEDKGAGIKTGFGKRLSIQ